MRLYLFRHAIAVPRGTPGYPHDAQRPLTEEGLDQAREVAQGLKQLKIPIDLIVSSSYLRALQTAEQLARVYDMRNGIKQIDGLHPEVEPSETSAVLRAYSMYEHVVLVGHEPHLSGWLAELVAQSGMRCMMKKGGVACVEIGRIPPPTGSGMLRWLMTPKQLSRIRGSNT
jgi:phosphohistidine phosphatase